MNVLEGAVRRIDAFQQRHNPLAFFFGVVKKYGDDNGGGLAVRLTFAGFTTVFPLLLLLATGLAIVLASDPSAQRAVLHSTFAEFPIVGRDLLHNIHVLRRNSAFGLSVGIIGLIYGTTGLASTGLYVMEQVWNIPAAVRPNYWVRMARSLTFLLVLAIGLVTTTFLSSFGTFGRHEFWLGIAAEVVAAIANVGIYVAAFRVLTPKQVETRYLIPGALVAGVLWTVIQAFGGYVVGHYLRDDNVVYGTFGTVLGLIAWLAIGAQITAYSAELNVVIVRRLWPRGLVQPPLTEADQRSIAFQAIENQRRPEQEVVTRVWGRPMTEDEYRNAGWKLDQTVIGTAMRVPDRSPPADEEGGP